jgi:hypothetical protein
MVSLEFNGLGADEIKRHPEVKVLLVTRDNRTEVMNKVLNWLTEGVNLDGCLEVIQRASFLLTPKLNYCCLPSLASLTPAATAQLGIT